jgi:uncharacterized protein (TIRG00374 family)
MADDLTVGTGAPIDRSRPRRVWKRVAIVVVVAFAAVFVAQHHEDVPEAWRVVRTASVWWLALAAALTAAWLVNFGLLHAAAQRAAGLPTRPFDVTVPAIAANFLNMITKSGGMAGLAMLLVDGRRRGNSRGPVVAAYLLAAALVEMAFGATLFVAMLVVWVSDRLTGAEITASIVFAVYLAVRVGILVVAWRSRRSLRRLFVLPGRVTAWLRRRPHQPSEHRAADDLHEAMALVRRAPARSIPTVAHALGVAVLGVLTLWAVVAAVGAGHSLIVALVGYSVTVLFTIVGLLPSGVGFVEVSLGAVLVSFGADGPRAAAVVVLYRIFQLWLPVIVGAVLAPRVRRAGGDPRASDGRGVVAAPVP